MKIFGRWFGNAGFEFVRNRTTLLVDPFLTRPKITEVFFGKATPDYKSICENINKCSHILVSHTHFDHFMDVPEIASKTGAIIFGSDNTCELAIRLGIQNNRIHRIGAGDMFGIGHANVKVISATHPWIPGYTSGKLEKSLNQPLLLRDYRMDTCLSFLIEFPDIKILVWNSTSTFDAVSADVLICRVVSNSRWYANLLGIVQPRLVIPSHWDDIFIPLSKPLQPFFSPPRLVFPPFRRIEIGEFAKKITSVFPECRVLVPTRFEKFEISMAM